MFDITLPDLFRFFIQLSLAVSGAVSFWSFVLLQKSKKSEPSTKQGLEKLANLMFTLFRLALILFLVSWWCAALFIFPPASSAHEGIKLAATASDIVRGFSFNLRFVSIVTVLALMGFALSFSRKMIFQKYASHFFLLQFILLSLVSFFTAYTGHFDRHQIFFALHHWHSFFTLGTVLTIDFLYLFTLPNLALKQVIYPFFPFMSSAIWLGLGLDFLSVALIFKEAFHVNTQFLFIQTVVGIIVLNGALLSQRINNFLIGIVDSKRPLSFSASMRKVLGASGSISFVSWITITFVDFFKFPFSYFQFFAVYATFIVCAYIGNIFIERSVLKSFRKKFYQ